MKSQTGKATESPNLAAAVQEAFHGRLSISECVNVVEAVIGNMTAGLKKDQVLRLNDLGVFTLQERNERLGVNPRTGEKVVVSGRTTVTFRPSQAIQDSLGS